jgi:NAD-dependent deacetylase
MSALSPTQALAKAIDATNPGQILIVTGAGVSHASGIPTFRGNDYEAIWKRDPTELGTRRYFETNPAGSWKWYMFRYDKVREAKPNPGHFAIAALERYQTARGGDFLLVTQNIDTLHEQAGSQRMIKVHGTSDHFRCSWNGCKFGAPSGSIPDTDVNLADFRANPVDANVPRCPSCNALLRVHVLWFDESYTGHDSYRWDEVCKAAERQAKLVIFAGTSFSVGVTDLVLRYCDARNVPIFNIDPDPRINDPDVTNIAAGSEVALVEVCKDLGIAL